MGSSQGAADIAVQDAALKGGPPAARQAAAIQKTTSKTEAGPRLRQAGPTTAGGPATAGKPQRLKPR
jgi:hypothetical protein